MIINQDIFHRNLFYVRVITYFILGDGMGIDVLSNKLNRKVLWKW